MAFATMRAFAKVKSSAMMARQPSVPNLICTGLSWATGCSCCTIIPPRSIREGPGAPRAALACLQQVLAATLFEPFHDLADLLRAMARAYQQCVRSFDHDEIADADSGNEFCGAPNKIAFGFEHVACAGEDIVMCGSRGLFVDRGPRTNIAPADVGGNHENAGGAFFASDGFENGVVYGNIFQPRINGAKFTFVFACAEGAGEHF